MPKLLSDADYWKIIHYKETVNMNNVTIAENMDIQRQTVAAVLRRHRLTGNPLPQIKGNRRRTNSKTTPEEDNEITEYTTNQPFRTPREIKAHLNLRCSIATIKRRLRKVHLHGRRAATKTYLTEDHKRARLEWCKSVKGRSWKNVIFSDEVSIKSTLHGMKWVRRPPKTRYDPKYIREMDRGRRCSVMVWGAITHTGMPDLVFFNQNVNARVYIEQVLEPVVRPLMEANRRLYYQQDNAPPHRARLTKNYLQQHNMKVLKWPACSPDLNIIENLWPLLKAEVGPIDREDQRNKEHLIGRIRDAWNTIKQTRGQNYLTTLYNSMDRRIKQCIRKKGGITKY